MIWSWYTGRWWVGCDIWYSEEGTGRGRSPPMDGWAVPNVTAHPSTANLPITVLLYNGPLLCGFNVPIKGLTGYSCVYVVNGCVCRARRATGTRRRCRRPTSDRRFTRRCWKLALPPGTRSQAATRPIRLPSTSRSRTTRRWARRSSDASSSACRTISTNRLWRWRSSKPKVSLPKTSAARPTLTSRSRCCRTKSTRCRRTSKGRTLTRAGMKSSRSKVSWWLVHWPLMDWLLHMVQRWGDWVGCGPAQSLLAVPNVRAHTSTASGSIIASAL